MTESPRTFKQRQLGILKRAKERISEFHHWTCVANARNKDGRIVAPYSPDACQWCAVGALLVGGPSEQEIAVSLHFLLDDATPYGIIVLNDGYRRTVYDKKRWEAVLEVYDQVIGNLEKELA